MRQTFPQMQQKLQPGESGNAVVTHFSVSLDQSQFTALRPGEYVPAGDYVELKVGGVLMMTDTRMEHRTNYGVVQHSKGHVFIAGLGIGMVCHAIAAKREVKKITVLEKSQGVIDLVAPTLPKKVEVIQGDIFEFKPAKETQFDTIYFDIWPDLSTDLLPVMSKLHRRFRRHLTPGGWIDSWCRDMLKASQRRERQQERAWHF